MRKLHSGMDAWHYIVRSESKRKTIESYLPLILSATGALGVLPFAIMRIAQGEWISAIVDFIIIFGLVILGTYVYKTRRVRVASVAIAVMCLGGALTTIYVNGPQQTYWIFPALMAIFYLTRPREAIVLAVATIALLLPQLLPTSNSQETTTVLITIVMTSAFAFAFSLITNYQREKLLLLATKDPLTGAGNRRSLEAKLEEVVGSFKRSGTPVSLVLLDLDHFKKVNDVHGHAVGDQILKRITEIIDLRIRVTDSLYRIGGEEFVVVLEGANLHRAAQLAEQLRTLVDANELAPNQAVTISLGAAELKAGEGGSDWLHRADEALYRAKDSGRNSTSLSA